jgi:hypothetical protein
MLLRYNAETETNVRAHVQGLVIRLKGLAVVDTGRSAPAPFAITKGN